MKTTKLIIILVITFIVFTGVINHVILQDILHFAPDKQTHCEYVRGKCVGSGYDGLNVILGLIETYIVIRIILYFENSKK